MSSGLAPPGVRRRSCSAASRNFCWGLTTNPLDVSDTYQEKFVLNTYGLPTHTLYKGVAEAGELDVPELLREQASTA
jgi:penicillin amidase